MSDPKYATLIFKSSDLRAGKGFHESRENKGPAGIPNPPGPFGFPPGSSPAGRLSLLLSLQIEQSLARHNHPDQALFHGHIPFIHVIEEAIVNFPH